MSGLTKALADFLDGQPVGVLATSSGGGVVHQSLVYFVRDGEEILISTLGGRRKALDVTETGRASLCVMGHERPFPSVTVSGRAEIRRSAIGEPTALIAQLIMGVPEPPEQQSDEALAAVDRVILALHIDRVGPASYIDEDSTG